MTPFDCPKCKGTGFEPIPDNPEFDVDIECPSCGGSGIDPELVEVAARELFEHGTESGTWKRLDRIPSRSYARDQKQHYRDLATHALAAMVAYWKEKE